jgi:hypothetical protein
MSNAAAKAMMAVMINASAPRPVVRWNCSKREDMTTTGSLIAEYEDGRAIIFYEERA